MSLYKYSVYEVGKKEEKKEILNIELILYVTVLKN
jgi:hypothetical protein